MIKALIIGKPLDGVQVEIPDGYADIHVSFVARTNQAAPSCTPKPKRYVCQLTSETTDSGLSILQCLPIP